MATILTQPQNFIHCWRFETFSTPFPMIHTAWSNSWMTLNKILPTAADLTDAAFRHIVC